MADGQRFTGEQIATMLIARVNPTETAHADMIIIVTSADQVTITSAADTVVGAEVDANTGGMLVVAAAAAAAVAGVVTMTARDSEEDRQAITHTSRNMFFITYIYYVKHNSSDDIL